MAQMDLAAANAAARTKPWMALMFHEPVFVGNEVSLYALSVARAGSWLGSAQRILDPFDRFRSFAKRG